MNLTALKSAPFRVYGNLDFRGKCPKEEVEQITFFNRLRREHPDTWGRLAIHPANEGQRKGVNFTYLNKQKAMGLTAGSSDIIIPAAPSFICEMKRRDPTQSKWQEGQQEYLEAAHKAGAFSCVAFGYEAAWEAFEEWLKLVQK